MTPGPSRPLSLEEAAASPIDAVGGKARNLGRLVGYGFPVPPAIVVPRGELPQVAGYLADLPKLSGTTETFAVRSSGTSEDSSEASWAGVFTSTLNVTAEDVDDVAKSCVGHATDDRVAEYAAEMGLASPDGVAVIVQRMVDAAKAGAVFTHSLDADTDDEVYIEVVRGLADDLMEGHVSPQESITYGSADGSIARRNSAAAAMNAPGLAESRTAAGPEDIVLSDAEVEELAGVAADVVAKFGAPQDIEWAYDRSGKLWLLQARPITATARSAIRFYTDWDPSEIFRWGPLAGRYFYLSDYVTAACGLADVAKGLVFPPTALTFSGDQMVWLASGEAMREFNARMFREVCMDSEHVAGLRRRYEVVCRALETHADQPWDQPTKSELADEAKQFYDDVVEFWLATIPAEVGNWGCEDVLDEDLRAAFPHDGVREAITSMLMEPRELTVIQEEDRELLAEESAARFWRTHRYDASSYFGPLESPIEEFEDRRRALNSEVLDAHVEQIAAANGRRTATLAALGVPREVLASADVASAMIRWQEERKRVANRTIATKSRILNRAAELLDLPIGGLECLAHHELVALLRGEDRVDGFVGQVSAFLFPPEIERTSGREARELWSALAKEALPEAGVQEFDGGEVAFESSLPVTGIARIIENAHLAGEFNDGDILIASRTSPDYLGLMRRAGAIVTDIGGQTSHAATESREIHVPCIVGTGVGTQLVDDGERITVIAAKHKRPGKIIRYGPRQGDQS